MHLREEFHLEYNYQIDCFFKEWMFQSIHASKNYVTYVNPISRNHRDAERKIRTISVQRHFFHDGFSFRYNIEYQNNEHCQVNIHAMNTETSNLITVDVYPKMDDELIQHFISYMKQYLNVNIETTETRDLTFEPEEIHMFDETPREELDSSIEEIV